MLQNLFLTRTRAWWMALILLSASLWGCGDEEGEDAVVIEPDLTAVDQDLPAPEIDRVVITTVVAATNGFVAVYADASGALGELLGASFVRVGTNVDVIVGLGRDGVDGERLIARLHEDSNGDNEFDENDDDIAQNDDGEVVESFTISVP